MQDKLFIYLHTNDLTNPSWATRSYTHRGEIESLAQAAIGREVVVIVPAEDVLLLTATLPKMSRSRLLQALPFALEEQLIAEVEDLHFASGEYQTDGSLPVAVVAHKKMQQWLELLRSWNVTASKIIPLTLAISYHDANWHVVLQDMAVVRTGLFQGFACDTNNFIECLQLAIAANVNTPSQLYLHNYTNQAYAQMINTPMQIEEEFLNAQQMMDHLTKSATDMSTLNLLQGAYAVKKAKFPKLNLDWKVVGYLAAACTFLIFLYPAVSYFILKNRLIDIEDQIAFIYKRNFPQATSMVAPKRRLQEKLQNLSAQIGENKFLLFIGFIGKGMLDTHSIKVKQIDFQNGQLMLELTAATSEDFSAFADYLTRQGLNVKQQNANLAEGRVSAMLQIE